MTTRKIAEALFITRKTVEYHHGNVYQKVDVSSRAELRVALSKERVNQSQTLDTPPGVTGRGHP
jgi:DNA-binding NarL/FixJ family response regulator